MQPRARAASLRASRSCRVDRSLKRKTPASCWRFAFCSVASLFVKVATIKSSSQASQLPQLTAFFATKLIDVGAGLARDEASQVTINFKEEHP